MRVDAPTTTLINPNCPGCTDLTTKLVTADSMAVALELMLIDVLSVIDAEDKGYRLIEACGDDIVKWWAERKPQQQP